jgi:hypothetical protein
VEERVEMFEPLVTEIHQAEEAAGLSRAPTVPAGIARLKKAGREFRNALLLAGLLAVLSLILSAVFFLSPGKEADVVWQEEFQSVQSVLVEGP